MQILRDVVITTRKNHNCFCCGRLFPKGSRMKSQVNADSYQINNIWTCLTCEDLISKYPDRFICNGCFEDSCIADCLDEGQTPEDLLNKINLEEEL
jgi:hypothetical protein